MERNSPSHYNEYPPSTTGALRRGSLRMYECGIEHGRRAKDHKGVIQEVYLFLQAKLLGDAHRLSPLPVRTLEKVWQ